MKPRKQFISVLSGESPPWALYRLWYTVINQPNGLTIADMVKEGINECD